jgi:hypothetical protein
VTSLRAVTRRAVPAAFLLFAAALLVVSPAEASRTTTDARSSLASSSSRELASLELPSLDALEPIESVDASLHFGFGEDLGLLDPEAGPGAFVLFAVEAAQCELTYARNNPLKYVDPDGREVSVAFAQRTPNNIFGHVALILNGTVYSFGTNDTHGPDHQEDWGRSAADYLNVQAGRRSTEVMTLAATPEQEAALAAYLSSNNPNASGAKPHDTVTNSCVTVTERALERTGILPSSPGPVTVGRGGALLQAGAPRAITPSQLADQLKKANVVTATNSIGTHKVSWLQSVWGTLKHAGERLFRRAD